MKHFVFDVDDTLLYHRNNVNYQWIYEDSELTYYLNQIKSPKHIFSNGNARHVKDILTSMKIKDKFSLIVSRENFGFKPHVNVFQKMNQAIVTYNSSISQSFELPQIIFFDDRLENLQIAKIFQWKTVWIHPQALEYIGYSYVDYGFQNIKQALQELTKTEI